MQEEKVEAREDADPVQVHWEDDQKFPTHLWFSKTVGSINQGGNRRKWQEINNCKYVLLEPMTQ